MHDYQTGMPRGQTGPMLCMAANEPDEHNATTGTKTQDEYKEQAPDKDTSKEEDLKKAIHYLQNELQHAYAESELDGPSRSVPASLFPKSDW